MSFHQFLPKVQALPREDLERLCAQALFHLRCVSGSRNSFDLSKIDEGFRLPPRDPQVESMHLRAVEFIRQHEV